MKEKIYKISYSESAWGHINFVENQVGAVSVPKNVESILDLDMIGITYFKLPKKLIFASDFKTILKVDYPKNDLGLFILKKKMFSILQNMNITEYRSIPVTMLNHLEMEAYHIEEGLLLDELKEINSDFVALQLMNFTDAFDYENSNYKKSRVIPDMIRIRNLVIKEPVNGFPSLFKISEDPTLLFIAEEAKNALEAAGIKGCVFEEVEVSS